jgi:hypothetical protein
MMAEGSALASGWIRSDERCLCRRRQLTFCADGLVFNAHRFDRM